MDVKEVNIDEAFKVVATACEAYRGDKREHMVLEISLNAIKAKLDAAKSNPKEKSPGNESPEKEKSL